MNIRICKVSVVIVSYNVADLLEDCLNSLRDAEVDEIIVVDSSSTDGSAALVQQRFPDVQLQVVPNRGYGAGANAGLASSSGDGVLVLNADTVATPGAVEALRDALTGDHELGVVGPRLLFPTGVEQSSRRRFPTPWTPIFESTILEEWFPDNRWVRHYRGVAPSPTASGVQCVDWLVGAALMVRREVYQQTGGFNEEIFLYGEELEWCYRIRQHGWNIGYVSSATVIHHESASASQDQLASRLEFDRGRVRAQRSIHGAAVAQRTARLFRINYGLMLGREVAKWALGRDRALRRQRIARYWKLLRSELND